MLELITLIACTSGIGLIVMVWAVRIIIRRKYVGELDPPVLTAIGWRAIVIGCLFFLFGLLFFLSGLSVLLDALGYIENG